MTQTTRPLDDLIDLFRDSKVMPVVTAESADSAVETARALMAGGVMAIEITLRNDAAYDAIKAVKKHVPEIALGAGTVLHENHVEFCREEGVDFMVSPGTTDALFAAVAEHNQILIPGVATASEALRALEAGCQLQKLFPAEAVGGAKLLKSWSSPLPDITFIPTGGVSEGDAKSYLDLPNVLCVGGSWVVKGSPDDITRQAKAARGL